MSNHPSRAPHRSSLPGQPLRKIEEGEVCSHNNDFLQQPVDGTKERSTFGSRFTAILLGAAAILIIGVGILFAVAEPQKKSSTAGSVTNSGSTSEVISQEQLLQHNSASDCWLSIHCNVYDLTAFDHPGGSSFITSLCGQHATEDYDKNHPVDLLTQVEQHIVGTSADSQACSSALPTDVANGNPTLSAPAATGGGYSDEEEADSKDGGD